MFEQVCMNICMCLCMYVCVHVCMNVDVYIVYIFVYMNISVDVYMQERDCPWISVCLSCVGGCRHMAPHVPRGKPLAMVLANQDFNLAWSLGWDFHDKQLQEVKCDHILFASNT